MIICARKEVSYGGSVQDFRNGECQESSKDRKTREKTDHCNAPRCIVGNGK